MDITFDYSVPVVDKTYESYQNNIIEESSETKEFNEVTENNSYKLAA